MIAFLAGAVLASLGWFIAMAVEQGSADRERDHLRQELRVSEAAREAMWERLNADLLASADGPETWGVG